MHQTGLLDHAIRTAKQKDKKNPCSFEKTKKKNGIHNYGTVMMMKLREFSGAFFILGLGFGLAFLTLIVEFIMEWIKNFRGC